MTLPSFPAAPLTHSGGRDPGPGAAQTSTRPSLRPWPDFELPADLEAGEPPEARGLERDQVRLLVSYRAAGRLEHTHFQELPDYLHPGDVLVINTSATLPAALPAWRADGTALEFHLSTRMPGGLWTIELRQLEEDKNLPFYAAQPGETIRLPDGGQAVLLTPYVPEQRQALPGAVRVRLWIAELRLPQPVEQFLSRNGYPIRYRYVHGSWPLRYYQTVYAIEPGSAEMPSAGRAFTPELITTLVARGVQVVPLVLHTGVASLEEGEPPYAEYYRVPEATARAVNAAHHAGRPVVAVGTTVVRALETAAGEDRLVHPCSGWTELVITSERGLRVVDGLLTGLHEPRSSHLAMLTALGGRDLVRRTYEEALQAGYLWHEFGDLNLILP